MGLRVDIMGRRRVMAMPLILAGILAFAVYGAPNTGRLTTRAVI